MSNRLNVDKVVDGFLKRLDFDSVIAACTMKIEEYKAKIEEATAKDFLCRGYARLFLDKKDCTNFDEAIADCSNAIAIREKADSNKSTKPDEPPKSNEPLLSMAYRIRALAYYLKGDYERALADCEIIVDLLYKDKDVEDVAFVHELRAKIYYNQGKYDDAIKECKRSLTFPQNIFPSLSLVGLYRDSRKKLQHRD
jgi:tetratricopeptide (TPR) repeat protein